MPTSDTLLLDTCKLHEHATTIRARNSIVFHEELQVPVASDNDSFFDFVSSNSLKKLIINGASFNPEAAKIGNFIKRNKQIKIIFFFQEFVMFKI